MDFPSRISNICNKYQIDLMYLFGSQKNNAKKLLDNTPIKIDDPLADIDVGVVFRNPLPAVEERLKLYMDIYDELSDIFAPYHLDLVFLQENHSVFQAEALKGYCVYFSSEKTKDQYEEMILRRAADFRPVLEKYYQELLEAQGGIVK